MKKEELNTLIAKIESQRGDASCTYGTETVVNEQVRLNKLFIRLINEFNEKTDTYSRHLVFLTWAIALLTGILVYKELF